MRIFLLFAVCLELLALRPATAGYALLCVALCIVAIVLLSNYTPRAAGALVLGSATPLVCALEPRLLWVITALALLHEHRSSAWRLNWALPFLFVLLCWQVAELGVGVDLLELQSVFAWGQNSAWQSLARVQLWLATSPPEWFLSLVSFNHFLILFVLISALAANASARADFKLGLISVLPFALVITAFQAVLRPQQVFPNQSEYWDSLQRLCGTFSDPNAYGIFSFLLCGVLTGGSYASKRARILISLFAVVWLALALQSGSRSMILGLFLLAVWSVFVRSRAAFAALCVGSAAGVALLNFSPQLAAELPAALARSAASLQFDNLGASFFSRVVFLKAGWTIWLEHWLLGAGFNTFRDLYPLYASKLNLGTQLWSDNANNFYLGLLAELGVVGMAAFMLTLRGLERRPESGSRLGLMVLGIFALLLFFGPHLEFAEVSVLSAFLLAENFAPIRTPPLGLGWGAVALILAPLIFLAQRYSEHGLFRMEYGPDGSAVHWTARRALVSVPCRAGNAALELAALQPDLSAQHALCVRAQAGAEGQNACFEHQGWRTFWFDCPPRSAAQPELGSVERINVALDSDKVWIPADYGIGSDRRVLGVLIRR